MNEARKRVILLVDDESSLLVTLGDFLRFEGYEVVTADSAESALARLQGLTPDLIILDMSMPGMGGVGFLKRITGPDGKPAHPVLVLTARANMAEFFANVSVDGFIAKPCNPSDLLMEVGRILFLRGAPREESAKGASPPLRVLLGEDDPEIRKAIVQHFETHGVVVDAVEKGPEVLERAVLQPPGVVLMKVVLSGMNGDAVARMLHEMPKTGAVPIILYDSTGDDIPESRFTRAGSGVRRLVRGNKPWDLLSAAREVTA